MRGRQPLCLPSILCGFGMIGKLSHHMWHVQSLPELQASMYLPSNRVPEHSMLLDLVWCIEALGGLSRQSIRMHQV